MPDERGRQRRRRPRLFVDFMDVVHEIGVMRSPIDTLDPRSWFDGMESYPLC